MHTRLLWLIAFVFSGCLSSSIFKKLTNFDRNETPLIAFVEKQGYKIEKYRVETEDGYILTYHRIWPSNVTKEARTGYPVLLQHGLGTSSAAFLIPNKNSLGNVVVAYVLADAGYDVWLANSRGNRYSHLHKTKNSTSKEFWHYSLHELGMMDLAAGVDRVLSVTGWHNLALLGHSHGATKALVLVSSRPSYQAKISVLLALAPIVFLGPGHKRPAEAYRNFINRSIKRSNLLSNSSAISQLPPGLEDKVCLGAKSCLNILRLIRGTIDTKSWSIIQHFQPAGTLDENLQELIQQIQNGPLFKRFDYGPSKNIKVYKTETPPEYDLSKVNIPVLVYFAENDVFVTPEDIQTLASALPKPVVTLHRLNDVHFNHFDFLWSPRANNVVYKDLEHTLKLYSSSERNHSINNTNHTHYAEKSSRTKLLEATDRFIRHLQSFYSYNETLESSEKVNWPNSSAIKPNDKGMEETINNFIDITVSTKQTIDNNVIQYMYDEVNMLTQHVKYLETEYKISIKVINDHVIVIDNFDKLWEKAFIKNECNQNCKDILNNLKHLKKYEHLLNQPHVEVFNPKYIIKTNHEFFENKLAQLFKRSVNVDKVDLTSGSVREAVKELSSNVPQARVLVVAINDIYNLFSKLVAHKKYLNSKFHVQITGNVSIRLEIANFNKFLEYPYFTSNYCTFHCREMRLVKDHLIKYSSLLSTKIINIDNPSSYMNTTVWSILMKTKDENHHTVDSRSENFEPVTKTNISIQQINDLKLMLTTVINKNSIDFTKDNVHRILQSTEYSLLQKTLLRNTLHTIYETLKKLTIYKEYINSVYKVSLLVKMDQQVTVENFETLWNAIFDTEELCSKECLEIKKQLKKIISFKDLLLKRNITIDNPNSYDSAEDLGAMVQNFTTTQPTDMPEAVTADNLMDRLNKYLIHIRRNYNVTDNNAQVVKSDVNKLKLFIFKLNISQTEQDPYLNQKNQVVVNSNNSEVTQDLMTQLEKYLTYIRFTYGLGGSKLPNKKVGGYDQFMKTLSDIKSKCTGVCEENRVLIEKVCKFQKHLHDTYFNNASKWLTINCNHLLSDPSISSNNSNDVVLSNTTQPPYTDAPTSGDKLWMFLLFNNNESKGFVNLTSSTVTEIYTNDKTSKAQKTFYAKVIYEIYDVMQSLWMYKDYLKSTYGVMVTKTESSNRISIENFHNLWIQIYKPERKCKLQCKLIKLVLDKVKTYEEFLRKGVVMDNPQPYLDQDKGDLKTVKPLLPENVGRLTQDNVTLSMINIENTNDFVTQLEKYLAYIRHNYGLEGSKLANKIDRYIRLLKMLHHLLQPLSANDNRLPQESKTLPTINIKNTNVFITQLEKYLTYIRFNYGSEGSKLANKISEYIRFLKTLYETKTKCAGFCEENVLIEILCKFQKPLKEDAYFNSNFNRIMIKCYHLHPETSINTTNVGDIVLRSTTQLPYIETPKNLNNLWMLLFNNTLENKGIVNFTINRIKKIFTNIKTSEDQKKIYTKIIHNIYDVMESLWMYKDYLKSTYGVVLTKSEPFKRISIENFHNLWIQVYNQTKKCKAKCKIIKFILDKVKAYEEFLRKGVVIDNPHAYLDNKNGDLLIVQPLPLISRGPTKKNITMPINNTNDILTDLEVYLTYIKINYGLEGAKLAYKDVGGIDTFLKKLHEVKGKCAGLCEENITLIKRICRFQTHLHETYFSTTTNWMAIKCDNVRPETVISPSNNDSVSVKNTTQPAQIEISQINNNLGMLLFKNTKENNGVVDFTSNSIKEIFTNMKTTEGQKKIYTKIIHKIYDVVQRLWMYKDYLKSTYGVIVTKMEPSKRISIENFHNLWIQIYNQAKKCLARCKLIRFVLDKVKAYEEFLRKGVVIDNPQDYLDTKKGDIKSDSPLPGNASRPRPTQLNITLTINNTKGKDDIMTNLQTFLTYMRVYYGFGGSKLANKDVGGIDNLLKELHENKGKCAGICEENRALIEKVCKFQKHLQDTYFDKNISVLKTTCDFLYPKTVNSKEERISNQSTNENEPSTTHRTKTNGEAVSTSTPINNANNETNITKSINNQTEELQNMVWPLFHNNISEHFIDLSRAKVEGIISNIRAAGDVQRHLYVDTVYETYNTLLKLETYKTYLLETYSVEFTRTPQFRILVLNIKGLFESIVNDKPCTDKCHNIKSVIKTLEKFKNIFVYNTFIQIDDPSSYIDRKTGLIKNTTNDNSKGESSQNSLDVVIKSLELYLIQLSQTNVDISESQFSLDIQRTYKLMAKLNKLKEQGISNNDEVYQLYMEAQQFKKYLKDTYSLSFASHTTDDSSIVGSHRYPKNISIVKSFLFQTNESSQVVDLTKRSVDGKFNGLGNRFEFRNIIRVAVSAVYKIITKLILYEDYLRTHYDINIAMNNPDELVISNFSHIFFTYNETTTPCKGDCMIVRSILEQLNKYKSLLNVSTVKIDKPLDYAKPTTTSPNVQFEEPMSNSSILSDLNDITTNLNRFLIHIKKTYNINSRDSKSATDVRYIGQLLQDINNIKQKCTGNCIEGQRLLRRVSMFQKHLNERYYSNNIKVNDQGGQIVEKELLNASGKGTNHVEGQEPKSLVGYNEKPVSDRKPTDSKLSANVNINGGNNHLPSHGELRYDSNLLKNINKFNNHVKTTYNII